MGVGVERDVGEAEAFADEEGAAGEMLVHQLQRRLAGLALGRDQCALSVASDASPTKATQKRIVATLGS